MNDTAMDHAATTTSPTALSVPETVSSQRTLVTLLADFGFARAGAVPSAAIVAALGDFGITPAGARIALSRVARTGLLEQVRHGRQTSYTVNPDGLAEREERMRAYLAFGADHEPWDGLWTVATFSIPEENRGLRPKLRRELERMRFAPLTDAVWIQARDQSEAVLDAGAALDVDVAVLRATFVQPGRQRLDPVSAFPLDRVRALYTDYCTTFGPWLPLAQRGAVAPDRALVLRANVLSGWRNLALTDPDLPVELLPDDWPQPDARRLFVELLEAIGSIALERMREIVGPFDAGLAARLTVRHS